MYHPPVYIWAITLAGVAAIILDTCAVLYIGARRSELARRRSILITASAGAVIMGWFAATGIFADHGVYHTRLGHGVPWLPVAVLGFGGTVFALSRIPTVARALRAPGAEARLIRPHTFRVAGIAFLLTMALGQLPALFALPAGLGDFTIGLTAPAVARRLAQGGGRRAALWFTALGITDLLVALTLGALTGYHLVSAGPSALTELPLALIPTAEVPLLLVMHLTSLSALLRPGVTVQAGHGVSVAATAT
jgi:hypothetical protein